MLIEVHFSARKWLFSLVYAEFLALLDGALNEAMRRNSMNAQEVSYVVPSDA